LYSVYRFSRSKTEYIEYEIDEGEQFDETRSVMTISENEIRKTESFKYLGSFVQKNGSFDENYKHKITCG